MEQLEIEWAVGISEEAEGCSMHLSPCWVLLTREEVPMEKRDFGEERIVIIPTRVSGIPPRLYRWPLPE